MLVKDFLNIPSKFRSKTWRDIGKLIFQLSNGSDDGYDLFIMYSELDPNHPDIDDIYYYCYDVWMFFEEMITINDTV